MSPLDFDPRNDGYWGDTTATLDWCEQNYEVRKWHTSNPDSWIHGRAAIFANHR